MDQQNEEAREIKQITEAKKGDRLMGVPFSLSRSKTFLHSLDRLLPVAKG
jgi:hypothetical protein